MFRYLYADLVRVIKRASFWIVALIPALMYALFLYIQHGHYPPDYYGASQAAYHISVFPMVFAVFAGVAVLITVFHNDFKAKAIQNVIGSGVSRWKALLAKMIESTLLIAIIAVLTTLIIIITMAILGFSGNEEYYIVILNIFLTEALYTAALICLVSPILFFFQSSIGGIIIFLVIATEAFFLVLLLILTSGAVVDAVGDLTPYLPTKALTDILTALVRGNDVEISNYITILAYALVPSIVSLIIFQRRNLEV